MAAAELSAEIASLSGEKRRLLDALLRARRGAEARTAVAGLPPQPARRARLSFAQERIWLMEQVRPASAAYNIPVVARLRGELSAPSLSQALTAVVRRHGVLRSAVELADEGPVQVVQPAQRLAPPVVELAGLDPAALRLEAERLAGLEAANPFRLDQPPFLRAILLRIAPREHHLLLSTHHFAADGWSMSILVAELGEAYSAALERRPSRLPEAAADHGAYAEWQRDRAAAGAFEEDLAYWRRQLAGARQLLGLPTDRPRPQVQAGRGRTLGFEVPRELAADLEKAARRERTTLYLLLLAGFTALLHRTSGERDLIVAAAVSSRPLAELEGAVGNFSNNLPLRSVIEGGMSFRRHLDRIRDVAAGAFSHQSLPFERLVKAVGAPRSPSHHPLFQVVFVLHESGAESLQLPGLDLELLPVERGAARFDLTVELRRRPQGLTGAIEFDSDLFEPATVHRLVGNLENLLRSAVREPEQAVERLTLLSAAERQQLLAVAQGTAVDLGAPGCLHDAVIEQAGSRPEAVAIAAGEEQVSYGELLQRARRLAADLTRHGMVPGEVVGVATQRSVEQMVALLGILLAGGAYLPFEPELPAARLETLLQDARPSRVVLGDWPASVEGLAGADLLRTPDEPEGSAALEPPIAEPTLPAYLLYTSGSTGRPKGVLVSHHAIWNRLVWMQGAFRLTPADAVLHKTSLGFDPSIWECFWPLREGARLVLAPPGAQRDPSALVSLMGERRITVAHFVPSLLRHFLDEPRVGELSCLRLLVASGEALAADLAALCEARLPAELFNLYGPTEAAIDVTAWPARGHTGGGSVPIGLPIWNLSVQVVDPEIEPVPMGVPGELLIGGAGLADGYFGKPALTAERFVPDPLGARTGARLYRTGDRVRRLAGGEIEFLGRIDFQVKVAGYRIEPAEVETALAAHPRVRECCVVTLQGLPGEPPRLVAYVAAAGGKVDPEELREHLATRLPLPMLPKGFRLLDRLPRNASGKVDRAALSQLDTPPSVSVHQPAPPRNAVEDLLVEIWSRLLRREVVETTDNFFALGGDSLLGLELVGGVRRSGLALSLPDLFAAPTIRQLASRLVARRAEAQAPDLPFDLLLPPELESLPAGLDDAYPMSYLQQGMVFHGEMEEGERLYHNIDRYRLPAVCSPGALCRAWNAITDRHPLLRASFDLAGPGRLLVRVHKKVRPAISVIDVSDLTRSRREDALSGWLAREEREGFDLSRPALARLTVFSLGADGIEICLTQHHAVLDGWSLNLILAELAEEAGRNGHTQPQAVPEPPGAFRKTVAAELSALASPEEEGFWRRELEGARVTRLPLANPRRPALAVGEIARPLPAESTAALYRLAARFAVPVRTLFLAAHLRALSTTSGEVDLLTALITDTRPELAGAERAVGPFLNALPLRLRLRGGTWRELVQELFAAEVKLLLHRQYPAGRLEQILGLGSLFEVSFNFIHFRVAAGLGERLGLASGAGGAFLRSNEALGVTVEVDPSRPGEIRIVEQYDRSRVGETLAESFLCRMAAALEALVHDPEGRHETAPLMTAAERHQILCEWNATAAAEPQDLVAAFWAVCSRQPETEALRWGRVSLSFGDLGRQVAALSSRLSSAGVGAEQRVAVFVCEPLLLPVGWLAALDCGAAYLALDPAFPDPRLSEILEDSRPAAVLASPAVAGRLETSPQQRILVLEADALASGPPAWRAVRPPPGDAAASIAYTSGSTGHPKGVVITRRGLGHHLAAAARLFGLAPGDRVLQFASPAFDVAGEEILATLLAGATVVFPADPPPLQFESLEEELGRNQVSVANLPASYWAQWTLEMAKAGRRPPASLRLLVVGSETASAQALVVWEGLTARAVPVYNAYGPTEATVGPLLWTGEPGGIRERAGSLPVGRPIERVRAFLAHALGTPAPPWAVGELMLAGPGLARGYLGSPSMTAERFVPDPWGGEPGTRLYRTGDLARQRPDGVLELVGRRDQQVKIRGVRVEPAEVRQALLAVSGVAEAVVVARPDAAGSACLAAYLVASPEVPEDRVRAVLEARLPAAWQPAALVFLAELPRTSAGKLDLGALPAPGPRADEPVPRSALPANPMEELLAALYAEILGRERVGVEESFFALGGHSLAAMQLVYRLRAALGVELRLAELYAAPSVVDLARRLAASRPAGGGPPPALPQITPDREREGEPFPLTDVQAAYWIGRREEFQLGSVAAHGYQELDLRDFSHQRFEDALDLLVWRHGMLRAVVTPEGWQRILPEVPRYRVEFEDLSGLEAAAAEARLVATRQRMSHQVLCADRWPLFEVRASLLEGGLARLHLSLDALIADAWSLEILVEELFTLYREPAAVLPPLEISFRDYVLAERQLEATELYTRSRRYWMERLEDLPAAPELPVVSGVGRGREPRFSRRQASLPAAGWSRLKTRALRAGLTPSAALLAAYAEVLAAWSKSRRFTLNLTLFNRLPLHHDVGRVVGDFTSLCLVEVDAGSGSSFEERARAVSARLWQDLDHRFFNGVQVLRELARVHGRAGGGLMPVVFTSALQLGAQHGAARRSVLAEATEGFGITQTPQVWLDHQVSEHEGALFFNWDAVEELFPEGLLDDLFGAYCRLVGDLAEGEEAWTGARRMLVPSEQLALREAINATAVELPAARLEELFLEAATRAPDRAAVITAECLWTYGDLEQRSLNLACRLAALGARRGQLVAVLMEKGWEQAIACLGILRAGAAYLPLDPSLPAERLKVLLALGEVEIVVTQPRWPDRLDLPDGLAVEVLTDRVVEAAASLPPTAGPLHPQDLAYVIFTSGSTGEPKGVMIDHRGAVNTLLDVNRRFEVGPEDRVLALSSLSFDLSVYDLFGTWAAGAAVVLPEPAAGRDPAAWAERVVADRVTVWNSVPALAELYVEHVTSHPRVLPRTLRLVLLSGDWIPLSLPGRLRSLAPDLEVVSLGGATEASIWSILFPVAAVDPAWASIPYGRPMVNQTFHVLDAALAPRPVFVPGDLYIGGLGLALGYWRRPDLTTAAFVTHPESGERLYRAGDLGRYLPDGTIEFLGREDTQVKIQGYRVELGEVEAAFSRVPGVAAGAVLAVGSPRGGKALAAFFVPVEGAEVTTAAIASALRAVLPAYMVPGQFTEITDLPLSANGKVDRKALLARVAAVKLAARPARLAGTPAEEALAEIWASLLGVDSVSPGDNFFELGGNSLVAIRLVSRLRESLGIEISLVDFLTEPTLEGLAAAIDARGVGVLEAGPEVAVLTSDPDHRYEPFPLTDLQQAYWVGRNAALSLGGVAPHSYTEIALSGVDLEWLEQAVNRLVDRHDMLRAVVLGDGRQRILPAPRSYRIERLDLRGLAAGEAQALLGEVRARMSHQLLPADRGPLFEVVASRLSDEEVRLHLSIDLLIADAWSIQIALAELARLYSDPAVPLPELEVSFRDYVLAERRLRDGPRYRADREYWRGRLDTLPAAPALPRRRFSGPSSPPRFRRLAAVLDAVRWEELQQAAAESGLTPSGLLLACFAEVLSRWSREPRFTLNLTTFNRLPLHPLVDQLIGDFTATTLVGLELTQSSFRERARAVQRRLWEDLEHSQVSGVEVLRELARRRPQGTGMRMPVVFTSTLIGESGNEREVGPWRQQVVYGISQTPQVLLDCQVGEAAGELEYNWDYLEQSFPPGLIETMFDSFRDLLLRLAGRAEDWMEGAA